MIKNYIKIAIRNLQRNRVYSLINIFGLTIGIAACLLVATVVLDDLSYDRQWKDANDIYRIITVDKSNVMNTDRFPQSYSGLGPTAKKTFPEVAEYCRMSASSDRLKIGEDKNGVVFKGLLSEPSVWNMFDFAVIQGNPKKFVKGYINLVISEKVKKQFFAKTNPIGQVIYSIRSFGKPGAYLITGVIKDIPSNTHLRADILTIGEYSAFDDQLNKDGNGSFYQQYLMLKPGTSVTAFTAKINKWYKNYIPDNKARYSFEFQPLKDIYLKSDFTHSQPVQGSMRNVYIFSGVAILLLLIACINFINLTTARAIKRLREAGIRKVLGANRKELVGQFLFESLLFFLISFVFGILFYNIFLVSVEKFLEHPIALKLYSNAVLFAGTVGFVLLVSALTGLYPALLLSGRNPSEVISGKITGGTGSGMLRKSLVVAQFVISISIIVSAFVVHNQINFMDTKDLGFDKNNLVAIDFNSWESKGAAFKQEILKLAGVQNASISGWDANGGGNMTMQVDDPAQKGSKIAVWYIEGDADLAATLKLQVKQGRLLDSKLSTDALNTDSLRNKHEYEKINSAQLAQHVIITAYTAKVFNVNQLNVKGKYVEGVPVGVIKDFNNESLHTPLKPTIIRATDNPQYGYMLIRVNPNAAKQVLAGIDKLWGQFYPSKILKFTWTDETIRAQYKAEGKLQQLFTFFSLLVVFLACLGLFGLAAFTAEQRTKEIGIRKVLGASVAGITTLLSREFLKLVFLATLIASPIAWYAMNKWLQDFAYRINIDWWIFALAGGLSLLIAFVTVSFQSIKAAVANPVRSLRSE